MSWNQPRVIAVAIVIAAVIVERAIFKARDSIVTALDRVTNQGDRIGTKLDNLWSPVKGINTVLWRKSALDPSLASNDWDDSDT